MRRRRRRTQQYLSESSPILCSAWLCTAPPHQHTHTSSHLLLGKAAFHNAPPLLQIFRYDFKKDVISDSICNISQRDDPRTLAVHPHGDGIICAFDNYWKMYSLERNCEFPFSRLENNVLELEKFGGQHQLLFSHDGCRLAASGQDGHLRVFEWPSLSVIFCRPTVYRSLDLDISLDGTFLAYIANQAGSSGIAVWNMDGWGKLGVKMFSNFLITAIAMGRDGKHLAIASSAGDIHVIEIKLMAITERIRSAHFLQIVFLEFSPDSRALLSISTDSMIRVTALKIKKDWKEAQIYVLLALMVMASAVLFYLFHEYSDSFWNFTLGRS